MKSQGWWVNEETPTGEGARRDPTGSETSEEGARRLVDDKEDRLRSPRPVATSIDPTSCRAAGKRLISQPALLILT